MARGGDPNCQYQAGMSWTATYSAELERFTCKQLNAKAEYEVEVAPITCSARVFPHREVDADQYDPKTLTWHYHTDDGRIRSTVHQRKRIRVLRASRKKRWPNGR